MAFKASSIRQRKRKPLAQGKALVANAGVADAYAKSMTDLVARMEEDYRKLFHSGFKDESVVEFYGEDASPSAILKRILGRLDRKWRGVFTTFAKEQAAKFTDKVDTHSSFQARYVLKGMGLENPKDANTEKMRETLQASIAENVSLITNIQEKFATDIEGVVFRSLASSDPKETGTNSVMKALMERGDMSKRRAQLIAQDQNNKLYSALNAERMQQNKVELFKWKHVAGNKTSRQTHVERQTDDVGYGPGIYRFDSPELWEGPEADRGLPGQAIRCYCRMIPIIDLDA